MPQMGSLYPMLGRYAYYSMSKWHSLEVIFKSGNLLQPPHISFVSVLLSPPGFILALGVEKLESESSDPCLQLGEPGIPPRPVVRQDLRRTLFTRDSSVTLTSDCGEGQGWRLSYLVVEPN